MNTYELSIVDKLFNIKTIKKECFKIEGRDFNTVQYYYNILKINKMYKLKVMCISGFKIKYLFIIIYSIYVLLLLFFY